jgi:glycine cleavage system H lipoate-binding protein
MIGIAIAVILGMKGSKMKCPFLEEVVVKYCKASPARKMIPAPSLVSDDPCVGCPEKCSTYRESAYLNSKANGLGQMTGSKPQKPVVSEVVMKETEKEGLKECIWMKAGVIAYRLCTSDFDCKNCAFDQMLTDQGGAYGESPMIKEAIEKLRTMPADKRKCRYMLTGDISYKICSNNYECWHCPVDQMISDLIDSHPLLVKKRARKEEKVERVRGFAFHPKAFYQPNHIWVRIDKDDQIKVGIDDFAAKLLGDITEVASLQKGEELREISFKRENRIFKVPVRGLGKVVKTNEEVLSNPKTISQDPYDKGWLFTIENENILDNIADLLKGDDAKRWLEKDFDQLKHSIQEECEITIADGGELVQDFRNRLSEELINKLLEKFLTSLRKEN